MFLRNKDQITIETKNEKEINSLISKGFEEIGSRGSLPGKKVEMTQTNHSSSKRSKSRKKR